MATGLTSSLSSSGFSSLYDASFLEEGSILEEESREEDEDGSSDGKSSDRNSPDESCEDDSADSTKGRFIRQQMLNLERNLFVFKLWLRRINKTRDEDSDRCSSLQDFENAIHNACEVIKEYKEDLNLSLSLSHYKDLSKNAEKAFRKVFEEKKNASFEMTEDDVVRFHSDTSRLSAALGLKLDFLDRLEEIPTEDRKHQAVRDWIEIFLENNINSVISVDRNFLSRELLDSIGFDPLSTAIETIMARSFEASKHHHIEACEWGEIFLKDEFEYNPLLSPAVHLPVKFPFESNFINTWFPLPSKTEAPVIKIMNLVTRKSEARSALLSKFVLEEQSNIVLFHGTDHRSATSILNQGIDLCAGRQKRDFSCGSGFYLTKSLDDALNWANSTTAKPAILNFQVNHESLGAKKLTLNHDDERWRKIVSSFRSGQGTAKTRESFKSYDLIEGPMATVKRSETSEELVLEPKPRSYQMCLISNDFAEKFRRQALHSVVFLDMADM